MRDFRVIYKMLSVYKGMLRDNGDPLDLITPESMGTTQQHLANIAVILKDAKLIKGETARNMSITLAGLEYLEQNEKMNEIAKER